MCVQNLLNKKYANEHKLQQGHSKYHLIYLLNYFSVEHAVSLLPKVCLKTRLNLLLFPQQQNQKYMSVNTKKFKYV